MRDHRRPPPRPRSARPLVEPLEARCVPAVSYHGGPVLPHVEVEAVYLGQAWQGAPQVPQLDQFFQYLTPGPYLGILRQYGIGTGSFSGHAVVPLPVPPGGTIDDTDIQQVLDWEVTYGYLAPPDANRLYFVFTPPGVIVTDNGESSAADFFGYHNAFLASTNQWVVYAVVPHPVGNGTVPGLSVFQTLTEVSSHELAEAVTDPIDRGWYSNRSGAEISDGCNGYFDTLGGYVVQYEWSNQSRACVLPVDTPPPDPHVTVANAFTQADEYFEHFLTSTYEKLLGHDPSAGDVAFWLTWRQQGATDEQVLAAVLGSPEYVQRHGGTAADWIDAVYQDLLGRPADAAGQDYWTQVLSAGQDATAVAYQIATSSERFGNLVKGYFQDFLGRPGTAAELGYWVNVLRQGATDEQVAVAFVTSKEVLQLAQGSDAGWVSALYQDLLHRPADPDGASYWLATLASLVPLAV